MGERIAFPSLLHPKDRAYTIHNSSYDLNTFGNHHFLADWAGRYDTYGDGMVQHSPEYPAMDEDFGDYCGSLAVFILEGGTDAEKALEMLSQTLWWGHTNQADIQFAMTVKHDEKKRRWYSKQERKISSADSKRNDRRWEEIAEWMDGTMPAVFRFCLPDYHMGFLDRWASADMVVDTYSAEKGYHGNVRDLLELNDNLRDKTRKEDWSQAFSALTQLRESARAKDSAQRVLSCWQHNAVPKPETETVEV